ncbi:hypothetical protein SLE2022_060290 [Rubroshorea leprosula]
MVGCRRADLPALGDLIGVKIANATAQLITVGPSTTYCIQGGFDKDRTCTQKSSSKAFLIVRQPYVIESFEDSSLRGGFDDQPDIPQHHLLTNWSHSLKNNWLPLLLRNPLLTRFFSGVQVA